MFPFQMEQLGASVAGLGEDGPDSALKAAIARSEALLHEVDHRVKNNLQLIASLLVLQCRREHDPAVREALGAILGRVSAVAVVHRRLFQDDPERFDVAAFLQDLVDNRTPGGPVTIRAALEGAQIATALAAPLALAVNELLSNALRHAFPDGRMGHVDVTLQRTGDSLRIGIADDGVGFPADVSDGFGLTIVRLLSRQLKADFQMYAAAQGTQVLLTLPLNLALQPRDPS